MANVSRLVPSIHAWIAITSGIVPHRPEFAVAAASETGMRGLIDGTKAMAMTAVDLLAKPGLRTKIKEEFQQGNIQSRKAVLTIGASHLPAMIKYLKEKRISINAPLFTSDQNRDYISDVNLIKEKFAVFVILPKTIAQDRKVLEANRLEDVVEWARSQSAVTTLFDVSPTSN